MNTITLTGNVVSVQDLNSLPNGQKVLNFRMANNEYVNNESVLNGFFDVTVWGEQAVRVAKVLDKGERIVVTGRLNHRTFEREDDQGGTTTGSRTFLTASAVALSLEFSGAARMVERKSTPKPAPEDELPLEAMEPPPADES